MQKRALKAREPLSLAPVTVSQLTSLAVLGIDERRFRETFGKHPNASRVGKLLVLDVSDARAALRSMRAATAPAEPAPEYSDDDGPADADEVLARLGRRCIA